MSTPTRSVLVRAVLFFAFLTVWFWPRKKTSGAESDADRDLKTDVHMRYLFTDIET